MVVKSVVDTAKAVLAMAVVAKTMVTRMRGVVTRVVVTMLMVVLVKAGTAMQESMAARMAGGKEASKEAMRVASMEVMV